MKKVNTSVRLKQIMSERGLKQVDILRMCAPLCEKYGIKLNKNDLSQYVSGKVSPGQDKLTILGQALGVDEVWLMGYDSPTADQPDHPAVGAAKPALSDRAYMVGRAYEDSDYLTQRMVERTLGIEEEVELKEPAGRQAFTA